MRPVQIVAGLTMGAVLLAPPSIHRKPPGRTQIVPPPAFMRARLVSENAAPSPTPSSRASQVLPFDGPVTSAAGGAALELQLVERDRALGGRTPLTSDPGLVRAAMLRGQDMLARRYFSHFDPVTGQLAYPIALRRAGVSYRLAGENLAWSWPSLSMQWANQFLMGTADHRANILNPAFHRVGIAVLSGGGRTVLVELFAN